MIKFSDLERFDLDLAQELAETPENVLDDAAAALREILTASYLPVLGTADSFDDVYVRVAGYPEKIRRRDLREEHVNKLVSLDGVVQRVTEVSPKVINAAFKCMRCTHVFYIPQSMDKFVEPFECENERCGRKNCFKLCLEESEMIDSQKIRLQELPEELKGGEKSQIIDVNIEGDITGILLPGNKVTITGILRTVQQTKGQNKIPYLTMYLDANHIQINEGQEVIVLTSEDKERLRELAQMPDIIDKLVDSFAPTIFGMREIKEGILCSAVSNGLKTRMDGTPQREFSHILICSDPGMAKSNLKHALKNLIPNVVLSSGTGATKAGLTAAAIKDDFAGGSWSIEAGALPLADGGGLVIDEFDKFSNDDKKMLNDALSNCQFEINKAGFHLKLWTRCFVVALLNPIHGRFDKYENITDQLDIPPDTLSRFDLIFMIEDVVDDSQDRRIAEQMAKAWCGKDVSAAGAISTEDLQKYLVYAKTIQPVYSDDVSKAVINQFIHARHKSNGGRVAVTKRYVESLFRLAKTQAQLSLSEVVTSDHLSRAVRLLESSILQVGVDENGNLDADVIATGKSKSQRDKVKQLIEIIKEISNQHKGVAPVGEVVLTASGSGYKDKEIEYYIENLKRDGSIFEPSSGYLRVV